MKVSIIYWSSTGNTEKMAELIAEGAKEAGAEVTVKNVSGAVIDDVVEADIAVLGCPSMGAEVLEESEFEPFNDSILDKVSGKKLALFGSYDWGDGEWMRNWESQMKEAGANVFVEPLINNLTPEGDEEEKCRSFGKSLLS